LMFVHCHFNFLLILLANVCSPLDNSFYRV